MPIDVFAEEMVTMSQAAKRLPRPRGTKPISLSTMWRWINAGLKAEDGQIVRLETVRIGGTRFTSIEALRRFFDRLQRQEPQPQFDPGDGFGISAQYQSRGSFRTKLSPDRLREREETSRGLNFEFFGCERLIDECGFSKETLLGIFDRLVAKLPQPAGHISKAYDSVRRAVFTRAVEILQGKHGTPRGVAAAKAWIDSIDVQTYDVRQLTGVGECIGGEWRDLVAKGTIDELRRHSN